MQKLSLVLLRKIRHARHSALLRSLPQALFAAVACVMCWGQAGHASPLRKGEIDSSITLRGTSIQMPSPAGFADAGKPFPEAARQVESMATKSQRFYFVFAPQDEIRHARGAEDLSFKKFFVVTAPKKNDEREITDPEFNASRASLKEKMPTLWSSDVKAAAQKHLDDIARQNLLPGPVEINGVEPLGLVFDGPDAVAFAQVMRLSVGPGQNMAEPFINVVVAVKVRRHVVMLYCYGTYESQRDVAGLVKAAASWTQRILDANR